MAMDNGNKNLPRSRRAASATVLAGLLVLCALSGLLCWQSYSRDKGITTGLSLPRSPRLLARADSGSSNVPFNGNKENVRPGQGQATSSEDEWFPKRLQALLDQSSSDTTSLNPVENEKLRLVKKGLGLYNLMISEDTSPSSFHEDPTSHQDLLMQHPCEHRGYPDYPLESSTVGISLKKAFEHIGISTAASHWYDNTASYRGTLPGSSTNAQYDTPTNFKDRVFIADYNFAIEDRSNQNQNVANAAAPLRRWSDVFWLATERLRIEYRNELGAAGREPVLFEHVFRHNIANGETNNIAMLVTGVGGEGIGGAGTIKLNEVGVWPGKSYAVSATSYRGLALLAAPNVRGVAYLLAQHKLELRGSYAIDRIHIFNCEIPGHGGPGIPRFCIYVHVGEAGKGGSKD